MVPIYSVVSWLSILFYHDSVYFEVIGDCYEAFAIASFFSLMCAYIAPDLHSQKDYFRGITPKQWVWPLPWFQNWKCCFGHRGAWRSPRSGLTWFNVRPTQWNTCFGCEADLSISSGRLVGCLPVLRDARADDDCCCRVASRWKIL